MTPLIYIVGVPCAVVVICVAALVGILLAATPRDDGERDATRKD